MTIKEALERIDGLKPNTYDSAEKIRWLTELDARVHRELLMTHAHGEDEEIFEGYTGETEPETELLAIAPYDGMYLYYLESKIDYYNGEQGKFNNSAAMFNTAYADYANFVNRVRLPLCKQEMRYF